MINTLQTVSTECDLGLSTKESLDTSSNYIEDVTKSNATPYVLSIQLGDTIPELFPTLLNVSTASP